MDLKIYMDEVEELAQKQILRLLSQPAFKDAKVRIMPDVHAGKGCVIGFTADLGDKVIPNIVGVDIGCGMLTVALGRRKPDLQQLDDAVRRLIPCGTKAHGKAIEDFPEMEGLHCFSRLFHKEHLRCSLGSLGGGNHFIEVDEDSQGGYHLIIHSGSRNLGKQVCECYQQEAVNRQRAYEDERRAAEAALIASLKSQGRFSEIGKGIKEIRQQYRVGQEDVPTELCYLEGEARQRYLDDMRICQLFALRNREAMVRLLVQGLGLEVQDMFHTTHNYIDHESNIVRKGAISARMGERLLIPINMRDGCIYGTGKGNDDWNQSAPHGAGRLMSRSEAFRRLSLEEFEKQMGGIYSTSVSTLTLDESPMAYKGMDAILSRITPSVEVHDIYKPVYNFKAEEELGKD